jgi:hypothetical protein
MILTIFFEMGNQFRGLLVLLAGFYLIAAAAMKKSDSSRYFCTIYYTPRESGFTQERGFDVSKETRPGLKGREFPRDFLKAVEQEGCGKMKTSYEKCWYITFDGHKWSYVISPIGARSQRLIPKKSCSVSKTQEQFAIGSTIHISSKTVSQVFGTEDWIVEDHGGGLKQFQIDLYWGEDDPLGPNRSIIRPRGTLFERANDITAVNGL